MPAGTRVRARTLAVGVALLAGMVAAFVARAAIASGTGTCGSDPGAGPAARADDVCLHLVRVLGQRMGIAVGVATVIVVLTMIGLWRTPIAVDPRIEQGT